MVVPELSFLWMQTKCLDSEDFVDLVPVKDFFPEIGIEEERCELNLKFFTFQTINLFEKFDKLIVCNRLFIIGFLLEQLYDLVESDCLGCQFKGSDEL